jgi:hypothetical protein
MACKIKTNPHNPCLVAIQDSKNLQFLGIWQLFFGRFSGKARFLAQKAIQDIKEP